PRNSSHRDSPGIELGDGIKHPFEERKPVEVIDLVLEAPSFDPIGSDDHLLPGLDRDPTHDHFLSATHHTCERRHTRANLTHRGAASSRDDARIAEDDETSARTRVFVACYIDSDEPDILSDLWC